MKTTSLFALCVFMLTMNMCADAKAFSHKKLRPITIAVIDTGADITHSALQNKVWINPGESGLDQNGKNKSKNGIDDDGNGYIDDVYGWNFADNNNQVEDTNGHGTHIAGIISEPAGVHLMILKAFDTHLDGEQALRATVNAIHYAIKMHVDIINYSGGGSQSSALEEQAIREAQTSKILFVAAAGNERSNSDHFGFFPADYALANILSVAAVDELGILLPSSNFGKRTVHLSAIGKKVYSSLPNNQFGVMTGTSQATAMATRAAALVMLSNSTKSERSPSSIIQKLVNTGDHVNGLEGKTKFPVVINAIKAAQNL